MKTSKSLGFAGLLLLLVASSSAFAVDSTSINTEDVTPVTSSGPTGTRGFWSKLKGKTASCMSGANFGYATVESNGDLSVYVNKNSVSKTCTNPGLGKCYLNGTSGQVTKVDISGITLGDASTAYGDPDTVVCRKQWPTN